MFMDNRLSFDGLYGEDIIDFVREAIHIAPVITILEKNNYVVKPHTHKHLFQIFLIEDSYAELFCFNQTIKINSKTFFTIPNNVSHGISSLSDTKGWVVSISTFGLEKILKLDADIFTNIEKVNIVKLNMDDDLHRNFYHTLYKCINEFFDKQPAREIALEYLTGMLLIRLFRILNNSESCIIEELNSYKIQLKRFKELIRFHYNFKYSVDFYAEELNISTGHLNRICKKITNQTPKKIISDYFISEAKILLTKIDYSVSDVAFKLGFDDPSYFTRLFKQIAKESPRQFRKKIGL